MPLVGDVTVRCRNMAGDPCQVSYPPALPTLATSGGGIWTGTVYVQLTWVNPWGETTAGPEANIAGLANNAIRVSGPIPSPSVTAVRIYWSQVSGNQDQYYTFPPTGPWIIGSSITGSIAGIPPYKSSAYLPDTDGDIVSTFEMYRWLNAGLVELGRLTGGILDQTGVAMPAGNAEVAIPGWWLSIKYVWHNGWLTLAEQQSYTWLQSPVQGIPGIVTLWRNGAQQVMGTWPQPATAPALTTLSAPMAAGDTVANLVSAAGFTAPGMCLIDSENMSYSQASVTTNQLTGIVRGYSGTIAGSHLSGASVSQLILRLLGRRMPVMLVPGQSSNVLDLPMGWDAILDDYIMARFKRTEQDEDAAAKLIQQFMTRAKELRDDSIPLESRQVGGLYPLGGAAQTLAEIMDTVVVN
jgi:hypothetical protein